MTDPFDIEAGTREFYEDPLYYVYEFKQRLSAIWLDRMASHETLVRNLRQWCREAEASGIAALEEFARLIPRYSTQAAL